MGKVLAVQDLIPSTQIKETQLGKMNCITRDSQLLGVNVGKLTGHLKWGAPLHRDLVSTTNVESGGGRF